MLAIFVFLNLKSVIVFVYFFFTQIAMTNSSELRDEIESSAEFRKKVIYVVLPIMINLEVYYFKT